MISTNRRSVSSYCCGSVPLLEKITPGDLDFSRGRVRKRSCRAINLPLVRWSVEVIFPWMAVDPMRRPEWDRQSDQ